MSTSDAKRTLPPEAGRGFSVVRKIRFGQTDPAGIVYYPNYFDMFNEIVEDWFEEDIGMSFRRLHKDENLGIPMAHVECDFLAPCTLGEEVTLLLEPMQLGRTSLQMQISILAADEVRVRASFVVVFVDLSTYRSVEPPDHLRELINRRLVPTTSE